MADVYQNIIGKCDSPVLTRLDRWVPPGSLISSHTKNTHTCISVSI